MNVLLQLYQTYTLYYLYFTTQMGGKHYNKNFIRKYIKPLEKAGFICTNNGKRYTISRGDNTMYILHISTSAYHPLRRFLKNEYNYII